MKARRLAIVSGVLFAVAALFKSVATAGHIVAGDVWQAVSEGCTAFVFAVAGVFMLWWRGGPRE
jgi:hypothetical protein